MSASQAQAASERALSESQSRLSSSPVRRWPILVTVARAAFDAAVVVLAAWLAFVLRFGVGLFQVSETARLDFASHLIASMVWVAAVLMTMGGNRLYDDDTLFPGGGELSRLVRSLAEAVALVSVFVYFTQSFSVSRSWFALTALLSALLIGIERLIVRAAVRRERVHGRFRRPVILMSKSSHDQLQATVETVSDFRIVAHVTHEQFAEVPTESSAESTDLIVAAADFDEAELWKIVIEAGQAGRSVYLYSPVRSVRRDRLTVREIGGRTLMKLAPPYFTRFQAARKRAFDVIAGGALLALSLPVVVVIALVILLSSGWPILFGQERVGRSGRLFRMWKFRTMKADSDKGSGPVWTSEADPRRTNVGRILRRFSLDELPQLWNVVLGHMSLVGPRPEQPGLVERFGSEVGWYRYRHRIRPGMTGWAQIHGLRGNTPLDPRIDHDNWYIENWSISLDLRILMKTLVEVFRGRNAY